MIDYATVSVNEKYVNSQIATSDYIGDLLVEPKSYTNSVYANSALLEGTSMFLQQAAEEAGKLQGLLDLKPITMPNRYYIEGNNKLTILHDSLNKKEPETVTCPILFPLTKVFDSEGINLLMYQCIVLHPRANAFSANITTRRLTHTTFWNYFAMKHLGFTTSRAYYTPQFISDVANANTLPTINMSWKNECSITIIKQSPRAILATFFTEAAREGILKVDTELTYLDQSIREIPRDFALDFSQHYNITLKTVVQELINAQLIFDTNKARWTQVERKGKRFRTIQLNLHSILNFLRQESEQGFIDLARQNKFTPAQMWDDFSAPHPISAPTF